MSRYTLVTLSGYSEELISRLQTLGIVDVVRSHKPVDEHSSELLARASQIRDEMAGTALKQKLSSGNAQLNALRKELSMSEKWGSCSKESAGALLEVGYSIHFHDVSAKKFDAGWAADTPLLVISDDGDRVMFVTIEQGASKIPGLTDTPRPVDDIAEEISCLEAELSQTKKEIEALADRKADYEKRYNDVLNELDAYLAGRSSVISSSDASGDLPSFIDVFEAYAPSESDRTIKEELDKLPVYYTVEAAKGDDTPIKLRNNRFARQFEVLTGMYGMPLYSEFDPTPVLGVFFLLFFSLCMGDAGYGILLIALSIVLGRKMPDSGLGKMHSLIMLLGIGTLIVGFLLGTFFGLDLYNASYIPEWMKTCMIKGDVSLMGRTFDIQMVMAICIGIVHLCLAMTVKAVCYTKRFGFRETASTWGWLVLILGGLVTAGLALSGAIDNAIVRILVIIIGIISALGIFIFNKPGRNPLLNIGAGLWDTYGMVTGLLGDVLSYIRLYALGLAGGMLGAAFNNLALMVKGDGNALTWVFFILILIIGHLLNLAMSCLGAFVHPLRLSFVEYFKNSGYEGKGKKYQPLTKENNK